MQNEGNNTGVAPTAQNLGQRLRKKRKELGENQETFAARFNVSQAAVSDWERGISEPPAAVILWLLEGAGDGRQ